MKTTSATTRSATISMVQPTPPNPSGIPRTDRYPLLIHLQRFGSWQGWERGMLAEVDSKAFTAVFPGQLDIGAGECVVSLLNLPSIGRVILTSHVIRRQTLPDCTTLVRVSLTGSRWVQRALTNDLFATGRLAATPTALRTGWLIRNAETLVERITVSTAAAKRRPVAVKTERGRCVLRTFLVYARLSSSSESRKGSRPFRWTTWK